ncbi:MAG: alanine--glyoxylate aminotransferase family protein [Candidatus Omnitrophica bacterium]|nr:alanine--glyoxylate aminotransferase family protein [Candidatus Omnitrophota bacterium]
MREEPILLTPGPTPVPPDVLKTMGEPMIHHRTPQYQKIFRETLEELRYVYQTKGDVIIFASSGTGAMESAVANTLSPGERVLVLEAGVFGERFTKITQRYGQKVERISVPYGQPMDTDRVLEYLKSQGRGLAAVFCQLSDTSTGIRMEVEQFARALAKTETLLIVDAVSGLAVDPLKFDEWGVDVALSGSQKALMAPPGLSFAAVSEKAWRKIKLARNPRFYFDYLLAKECYAQWDTPFTPAISIVRALALSLARIQKEGLEAFMAREARLAEAVREALGALGLELFTKESQTAGLTAVQIPKGVDGAKLLSRLMNEFNIWMAGGQGSMKGKIMRIAHMGYIGKDDLIAGFDALETVLGDLGYKLKKGVSKEILEQQQGVSR